MCGCCRGGTGIGEGKPGRLVDVEGGVAVRLVTNLRMERWLCRRLSWLRSWPLTGGCESLRCLEVAFLVGLLDGCVEGGDVTNGSRSCRSFPKGWVPDMSKCSVRRVGSGAGGAVEGAEERTGGGGCGAEASLLSTYLTSVGVMGLPHSSISSSCSTKSVSCPAEGVQRVSTSAKRVGSSGAAARAGAGAGATGGRGGSGNGAGGVGEGCKEEAFPCTTCTQVLLAWGGESRMAQSSVSWIRGGRDASVDSPWKGRTSQWGIWPLHCVSA